MRNFNQPRVLRRFMISSALHHNTVAGASEASNTYSATTECNSKRWIFDPNLSDPTTLYRTGISQTEKCRVEPTIQVLNIKTSKSVTKKGVTELNSNTRSALNVLHPRAPARHISMMETFYSCIPRTSCKSTAPATSISKTATAGLLPNTMVIDSLIM